jgi:hypothetical protein
VPVCVTDDLDDLHSPSDHRGVTPLEVGKLMVDEDLADAAFDVEAARRSPECAWPVAAIVVFALERGVAILPHQVTEAQAVDAGEFAGRVGS